MSRLGWLALACLLAAGVAYAAITATVSCTGTGTRPAALAVYPAALAFGNVDSGAVVTRTFTIRNAGSGTLVGAVRRAASCSPWYYLMIGNNAVTTIPYSLGPGASQEILVAFRPDGIGPAACVLDAGP